jgi:hypothetical protein
MSSKEQQAEQSAILADAILSYAKGKATPDMNPGQIGAALAAAMVYYGRECGLDDLALVRVMQASMSTINGKRIGPVHD